MTDKQRVYLFDTTLRDGQQTPGVDFSVEEKVVVAGLVEQLGFDYLEGGFPGANPTDDEFFKEKRTQKAVFTAFGMTKRPGVSVENDPGMAALLQSEAEAICLVAKSWDFHVDVALNTTLEENLRCIEDSVKHIVQAGRTALVDCEHFFDGYKSNPTHAIDCARTAQKAGADWVVLCDTNGGTQPNEVEKIVAHVFAEVPGINLGIHAHNDTGQAVANSLAAVRAGARQVQGTLNGIGERCGNANIITVAATLALKPTYEEFEIGCSADQIAMLTEVSRKFDNLLNRVSDAQSPYVGSSAFATKAGIHASALLKNPETYEHVSPDHVGNLRNVMVSDQAGKSNFLDQLKRHGIEVSKDDHRLETLISKVKEREARGYAYESADASFELLARSELGHVPDFFKVDSYRVLTERRYDALGRLKTISEAVVKLEIDGELRMSVADGAGPVNALDIALRKDLGSLQERVADLQLVDYKVRILNGGTEAITRVLIESTDDSGQRWWTLGVSDNVIEASFEALKDSLKYKLLKSEI